MCAIKKKLFRRVSQLDHLGIDVDAEAHLYTYIHTIISIAKDLNLDYWQNDWSIYQLKHV